MCFEYQNVQMKETQPFVKLSIEDEIQYICLCRSGLTEVKLARNCRDLMLFFAFSAFPRKKKSRVPSCTLNIQETFQVECRNVKYKQALPYGSFPFSMIFFKYPLLGGADREMAQWLSTCWAKVRAGVHILRIYANAHWAWQPAHYSSHRGWRQGSQIKLASKTSCIQQLCIWKTLLSWIRWKSNQG